MLLTTLEHSILFHSFDTEPSVEGSDAKPTFRNYYSRYCYSHRIAVHFNAKWSQNDKVGVILQILLPDFA